MAIYLQSTSNTSLYFNGSTLNRGKTIYLALFDPITNARDFETTEEAQEVSEAINVPVTIVEA